MVIVDASIVYKWFDWDENLSLEAKVLLDKLLEEDEVFIVPNILLYELGNIFIHKAKYSLAEALVNWQEFKQLNLQIYQPSGEFFEKCIEFGKKYKSSLYDASYAVLAMENNCEFITADQKFVDQVNLPFVKHLGQYSFK